MQARDVRDLAVLAAKRYGIRPACYAGIGRLVAFIGMITLVATGLATVLHTSENLFFIILKVQRMYDDAKRIMSMVELTKD